MYKEINFGKSLNKAMADKRFSLKKLSQETGIGYSYLSSLRTKKVATMDVTTNVCRVLNISVSKFIKLGEEK